MPSGHLKQQQQYNQSIVAEKERTAATTKPTSG
jgi:hypothetical protein